MKKVVLLVFVLALLSTAVFVGFIRPAVAEETIYIRADGSIEGTTYISTVDNATYTFTDNIINQSIVVERSNIIIDGAGYKVEGTEAWDSKGIHLSGVSNVTIKNTNIKHFYHGIYFYESSNNIVSGNTITANNRTGIYIYWGYSENNIVSGNTITANKGDGIYIDRSDNNTIVSNNITTNNGAGIYLGQLGSSCFNNISGNNIKNNAAGIRLESSSNHNIISENNITNNTGCGVYIYTSTNNTICGNNIKNNKYGVYIAYYAYHNKIYHNNFIDNSPQADVYIPVNVYIPENIWDDDYPSGGNYWNDYTGVDEKSGPGQDQPGSDGIGDTPYIINVNNTDHYPLMRLWPPLAHELVVSITAPAFLQLGSSSSLNATVTNQGLNDEASVELALFINGTTVNSTTIPVLRAGDLHTLSYLWTPTVEGTYNVTAYARPVPGETSVENNQMTKFVTVAVSAPSGVQVGIKAGDWIKITYTITGWPAGTPYPEWLKVEFLSVEGTSATVRVTMHMSDGTEQNVTVPVDVVAGGQAFGLSGFVIPANLTVGDIIYMSGYGNVTIDGETTRTYAGASRTVVYASFSQDGTQLTYYWDKETGVMVEASTTSGGMTGTAKATETNMWEAAPSPFWMQWWLWAIVAVVIVALAGTIYFLRKRQPPTPTVPPPLPTEGTPQKTTQTTNPLNSHLPSLFLISHIS